MIQNKILKRYVNDVNNTYETVILPRALTAQVLKMAHGDLGHNGTHRTYMLLKTIILLEGIKTKCSKKSIKVLSSSMKKQTSSKICYLTF